MGMLTDEFIFCMFAIVLIILVSIQYTLNKILRVLNEIKDKKKL